MKKLLLPALALTVALFLYNCTGDDAALLNPENDLLDSMPPVDSAFIDTVYIGTDTVSIPGYPGDSIYFPTDSAVIDTIYTPVYPYPSPGNDTIIFPGDSTTAGRMKNLPVPGPRPFVYYPLNSAN